MDRRPLSDTLLDFGAPVLSPLGGAPLDVLRGAMLGVVTIWNAHVLALPVWGGPEALAKLEEKVRGSGRAELIASFEELGRRRAARFADDPRLVGAWSIELTEGGRGVRLTAESGLPQPEPR